VVCGSSRAGDWPQILGPHRNGIAHDEKIADRWPAGGPKLLWQRDVGDGVAGMAVADGKVIVFHRIGDEERIEALDAASGKPSWTATFPTSFRADVGAAGNGPRCVPLVHQRRVYVVGAGGNVHCVAIDTGKTVWSRPAIKEFQAPNGYFGAGSSPIVEDGKLIMNVGGARSGGGLVAFDIATGKTIWQATDEQASYSSPVAATIDGVRHVIFVTRFNVVSIDPDSGQVRFKFPFGQRGPTVNAANPLVIDGHIFVTASYGIGAVFAKVRKDKAQVVWANDDVMSSQYPTAIAKDGRLYGIDGRQDGGPASLRCVDPKAGKVLWNEDNFGMATLILAGDRLVILKTDGELVVANPTPDAFRPLARSRIFRSTTRALPALAGGLLYVRDETTLKCVDLRP
jgi:outer membrane protein assembly factor BamB